ncbi:MAG TPA: hypothetical protein VKA38_04025, partial [Draconibacterium sp.]|nr:hypothetical protein [Draconibacterium sp.]
ILIKKVLESIDDKIQNHFINFPNRDFRATFPETVEFDGDKYSVRINADGKLMMFHRENR